MSNAAYVSFVTSFMGCLLFFVGTSPKIADSSIDYVSDPGRCLNVCGLVFSWRDIFQAPTFGINITEDTDYIFSGRTKTAKRYTITPCLDTVLAS
jgi:hypothetical protein